MTSPRALATVTILGFCFTAGSAILASPAAGLLHSVAQALSAREADLSLQSISVLPTAGRDLTVNLEFDGRPVVLDLVARSVRTPDFQVLIQEADGTLRAVPPPPAATWRGDPSRR